MSSPLIETLRSKSIQEWRHQINMAISERGTLHFYERRQIVFHQGMANNTVYGIKRGLVEISGLNASGHEVTTSIRGLGEQFGWAEGLLGEPRTRQATALQDTELWQLSIDDFLSMLLERPQIMLAALGSAVHREIRFASMRYDLRGASAYDRVSYVLCQLSRSAQSGDVMTAKLHITHEEISRVCEMSRQTVTTILGKMQRQGILELGLRSIKVIDYARLAQIDEDIV